MLPTTTNDHPVLPSPDWKSHACAIFSGLRGLLTIWVFLQHATTLDPAAFMNQQMYVDRTAFNTSAFLLITGFATHLQTRKQPLAYGSWLLGKWFALIPLSLLAVIVQYPPSLYGQGYWSGSVSGWWQLYQLVMNLLGLGAIGNAGDFTAQATNPLGAGVEVGWNYFGSALFILFIVFAAFHALLAGCRNVFGADPFHSEKLMGVPAALLGLALTGFSLYLQSAAGDFPNEPGLAMLAAGQSGVLPMLLVGVCAAEVRHHLSGVAQAALGHWMVVDALFVGFVAVCFCPVEGLVDMSDTAAFFGSARSVALMAAQPVLFCALLLALSCQAWHTARAVSVHFVLKRSVLAGLFGKYSYTYFLFQLPVIFLYFPSWLSSLGGGSASTQEIMSNYGTAEIVLMGGITAVAAILTQRLQDTWVTERYIAASACLRGGGVCARIWADEQNPLRWAYSSDSSDSSSDIGQLAKLEAGKTQVVGSRG